MFVNTINATNFKAVYSDIETNKTSSYRQNIIKKGIIKKLNNPYPNDSKKRNYIDYLEQEKGLDIYIATEKDEPYAPICVAGQNKTKRGDQFIIGEYNNHHFKPEDVLNAHKEYKSSRRLAIFTFLATAAAVAFLLISGHKMNAFEKEFQQKAVELTEKIPDTLKNIVK